MSRVIGIDLGTSNTVVACLQDGRPVVIKSATGGVTTPSAVFCDNPYYVVGEVALNSLASEPDQVVQFAKRLMGKSQTLTVGQHKYSPEFISSLILRKVVSDAREALNEEISGVVITVPAYFGETQRQATFTAAKMAGLKVLRLINEPTAAALSYGISHRDEAGYVLVYDLGGGTFDVTILAITSETLDVVAIGGDPALGGKDFDDALVRHLRREIEAQVAEKNRTVLWDHFIEAELLQKAETIKKQLTARPSSRLSLKVRTRDNRTTESEDADTRDIPVRIDVTREEFEALIAPLLIRTEIIVSDVLAEAGLPWDHIRHILCVGGSSRVPLVRDLLERLSGRRPLLHDPDECVAKGAALQAALLMDEGPEVLRDTRIGHVLPRSIGVAAVKNGRAVVDQVLPGLTPLPCAQIRHGYTTSMDYQHTVQVPIFEGESTDLESYGSGPIGSIRLEISPPRRMGQPQISIRFQCDENGLIIAEARDLDTGQESRTTITLGNARSDAVSAYEAQLVAHAVVS